MARAVRPVKAKRKKIRVYKGDQGGDIRISGGVAKIRLTPKVVLLFVLSVCAAIAIVIVAARQGTVQNITAPPAPRSQEQAAGTTSPVSQETSAETIIASVELAPNSPTVGSPIELRFALSNSPAAETNYSVNWFVNNGPVQEGQSVTLQPGMFRKGAIVYAELTLTDGSGKRTTAATPPVTVVNTPPTLSDVTIEPKQPARGADLTAKAAANDADNDPLTCQYQWLVNGAPVGPAGPQNTFSTANLRKQDIVTVSAVCSDGQDSTASVVSSPVSFGNGNPEILSSAPDSVVNGVYTYQVVAKDPDGDTLQYRLEYGPAGMTIDAASGLVQWSVPKGVMYTGRNEVKVKVTVDDGNGGAVSQEFVIVLIDYVNY